MQRTGGGGGWGGGWGVEPGGDSMSSRLEDDVPPAGGWGREGGLPQPADETLVRAALIYAELDGELKSVWDPPPHNPTLGPSLTQLTKPSGLLGKARGEGGFHPSPLPQFKQGCPSDIPLGIGTGRGEPGDKTGERGREGMRKAMLNSLFARGPHPSVHPLGPSSPSLAIY